MGSEFEKYTAFSDMEPNVIYQHGMYTRKFLECVSAVEIDGVRFERVGANGSVVSVTRCRECKNYERIDENSGECMLDDGNGDYARWRVDAGGYCYFAERKDMQ